MYWWWPLRAAETCSCYWICYNKSCVTADCVLIIACPLLLCCVLLLYTALLTWRIKNKPSGTLFPCHICTVRKYCKRPLCSRAVFYPTHCIRLHCRRNSSSNMESVSSFCADKISQAFSHWLTEMLFPISDPIKIISCMLVLAPKMVSFLLALRWKYCRVWILNLFCFLCRSSLFSFSIG